MDEVLKEAVQILLGSGWTGVLIALVLVFLYAFAKQYLPKLKAKAPAGDEIPPATGDWETDPDKPGGGMGGG